MYTRIFRRARNSGLPDPGHLSALCIGMLALGFFLISNLRIFRIPAMACSKVDEFLEARPFSFALPNESDFPKDAKVRDWHLLYGWNLKLTWHKRQAYSSRNKR